RERAGFCCEYCRLPAEHVQVPFEVEHVVAKQHGGSDSSFSGLLLALVEQAGSFTPADRIRQLGPTIEEWGRGNASEFARLNLVKPTAVDATLAAEFVCGAA